MAAKYKQYVKKMLEENSKVFDDFKILHDKYALDQSKWQDNLNLMGKKIQEIVNEYENRLCKSQESGGYSQYSHRLAEKFQDEIKSIFPFYDHIGLIVRKKAVVENHNVGFQIKKIRL